jgi:alpha/beta superfamily hydrolase
VSLITFRTEDGLTLEGELRSPDGRPRGTAVICHPHPQHGGSKDHPVLWAIRNDLASNRGLCVLGFNFRGIMGSEGEFGDGIEEVKDARAAVDRVREEAGGPTILVGWSFGAHVGLRYAVTDDRIAAVALVGMPLGEVPVSTPPLPAYDVLRSWQRPLLLVAGDDDPFSPVPLLLELSGRIPNAELRLFEGAGHFFRRREREPAEAIGEFVDGVLEEG